MPVFQESKQAEMRSIFKKYLDDKAVMPGHQESKQAKDGYIFFLDEVHWVAVTTTFYFDDSKKYKMRSFTECIEDLKKLLSPDDYMSSTGDDQSMDNDQSTEVVDTAEALGIRGGGDDIDEPSVDYEGSGSEEEEGVETMAREMCSNANEKNDIPVEGTVGATQHDISPGGHDGDKCLNDKEKNDIHDEVFVVQTKQTLVR